MSTSYTDELVISAIVMMSLFSLSAVVSIYGLLKAKDASNSKFLRFFFIQTLCISLLELSTSVLVYFNPTEGNIKIQFIQRCINSFSLVFQFALILTITYGWKVACWKIKQSTYSNFATIRIRRAAYIIIVACLFSIQLIASIGLLIYLLITGKTHQLIVNILDIVFEVSILVACISQMVQGIKLSKLLTTYQILFGVTTRKMRFNIIYVAAFILNIIRCVIQIMSLSYYFAQGKVPRVIINNPLAYYLFYTGCQLGPMVLYLIAIKVSGGSPGKEKDSLRQSSHRSSIQTQMMDRASF